MTIQINDLETTLEVINDSELEQIVGGADWSLSLDGVGTAHQEGFLSPADPIGSSVVGNTKVETKRAKYRYGY